MKIVDIVKFNDRHAFVLDKDYPLTYEKHGDLLIGSDKSQTFFDVLYYSPCGGNPNFGGNYAFGGRKFDLKMKDGSVTHCYGQYWDGKYVEAQKILGIEFSNFPHGTIDSLRDCYVFMSGTVDKAKLEVMIKEFSETNPDYQPWEYDKYKQYIRAADKTGACENCHRAEWNDMYGHLVWGCGMSHCIAEDDTF